MRALPFGIKKRALMTILIMLMGVTLAAIIFASISEPKGDYDYLHAHLAPPQQARELDWGNSGNSLTREDRVKIAHIITQSERSDFSASQSLQLTGQALKQARAAACELQYQKCKVSVRLARQLDLSQLHGDFRVTNIKETSLRGLFEAKSGGLDIELKELAYETRLLRFYQTQNGWVQNTAEVLETAPPSFEGRLGQFDDKFSSPYTGLNYYPASASWKAFWMDFPIEEIEDDLKRARALNVDALRIFLNHEVFDTAASRPDALMKLNRFLDLCADHDMSVLITLFDLRPNYAIPNWSADIEHIDNILPSIVNHSAILGIDIKNQADLDFAHWGEGLVKGWLTIMARHIQLTYPEVAVTIGWSDPSRATGLHRVVDFVSYHEYRASEGLGARLDEVMKGVEGKPVMITEIGSTTWRPPFVGKFGERAQAKALQSQLDQAGRALGVFIWTLNDFDHVSADVVGPLPWRQAQQKHYGLLRKDKSLRPSADVLKAFSKRPALGRGAFQPQPQPQPQLNQKFQTQIKF